nr:MAG TPA: hypothetical protein [Caudoviricetes sp.]
MFHYISLLTPPNKSERVLSRHRRGTPLWG